MFVQQKITKKCHFAEHGKAHEAEYPLLLAKFSTLSTLNLEIIKDVRMIAQINPGIVGVRILCRHNFEHNRMLKALSIMPA